jgi:ADP-ribose pyrophosphatase YjhB (NUDIX family)
MGNGLPRMTRAKTIRNVVGFVTRRTGARAELLLLKYPDTAARLPDGIVDMGESLEQAVLRQVGANTGLRLQIKRKLGQLEEQLPDDWRIVVRMTKLFDEPSYDASSQGFGLTRGSLVQVTGEFEKFSAVDYELLDDGGEPPMQPGRVSGYVRHSLLSARIERHLYELSSLDPGSGERSKFVGPRQVELLWVPLKPQPEMATAQAAWLDLVYDDLVRPHANPEL